MPNPSKAKSWIFRIIQPSDGYLPSRIFDLVIMALIAISVLSVFAATFSPPKGVVSALMVIEIISCVVFRLPRAESEQDFGDGDGRKRHERTSR